MNNDELIFEFESGTDVVRERLELAADRIREIADEGLGTPEFSDYFKKVSEFLLLVLNINRIFMHCK